MAKPLSSSRQRRYTELLKEAVEEFNDWLSRSAKHQDTFKYCIKCHSRKTLPGLKFCKHCSGSIDRIKPRMRRKVKNIIVNKVRAKRTESLRNTKICSVEGCNEKYHAKGLCIIHYNRVIKKKSRDRKKGN